MDNKEEFLAGYESLDKYFEEALKTVAKLAKFSNEIPSDRKQDWDYYSSFADFRKVMNVQGDQIREMIVDIMKHHGLKVIVPKNDGTTKAKDILEMLADANDQLLERIQTNLDEAEGLKKEIDPVLVGISSTSNQTEHISGSWNKKSTEKKDKDNIKLLAAKNITRPQLNFKEFIDNRSGVSFVPRLKEKPNAMKPLSILVEYTEHNEEVYSHPYLFEIDNVKLTDRQLMQRPKCENRAVGLEKTDLFYIDTAEKLKFAIKELSSFPEISVDLEHHSYRTFQGITCLIQISTREKDYIVDPFPIWAEMPSLNEVMANPKIVKIFHGSYKDIVWLQRDFSVYVVNLFDTYVACLVLGFPSSTRGLKHLLKRYVNVETNKEFQLADWRIRPLPELMERYARLDTHHLIDIYHDMKQELINQSNENLNLLRAVYDQSNQICKQKYEKPSFHPDQTYLEKLQKMNLLSSFNSRQTYAFKELFNWRNQMARQEDESEAFVLKDHELISICSNLPRELQGILSLVNPVPPLVRQNLVILHEHILKAREQPLKVDLHVNEGSKKTKTYNNTGEILENPLKSPLDTCQWDQEEDLALPCLIAKDDMKKFKSKTIEMISSIPNSEISDSSAPNATAKAQVTVFGDKVFVKEVAQAANISCISPFERYEKTKSMVKQAILNADNGTMKSDEERVKSVMEHFQSMTKITPHDLKAETEAKKKEQQQEDSSEDSDDDPGDIDHYDPEPSLMQPEKKATKRLSNEHGENLNDNNKRAKVDLENVDFTQFSKGVNPSAKVYDPSKDGVKGGKTSKARQRFKKSGGRSISYKK